ncbi:uncharacterized protein LOC130869020 isoform X2 [Chionomys nivalis]|uniref:uncharacterized protein LOC130869020 isoform X2 n=1 Tax=Chionomys nivalis TaxID=269649 RepID=UPI0025926605|nr:uncharacterized protein LOC130869020 isoform X2 [Chionomys nivalis]
MTGLSMGWSEECVFSSIDRSLQQILQHLENARSTLLSLQDSQDLSSSSVSDIVGREAIPPSCYCTAGNRSYDSSVSSVSSSDSSNPSYLPVFPGGATWQLHSHSLPAFSRKEPPAPRSQGSSLPIFQQADLKKADLFQNLAAPPPLKTQRFFINSVLENLDSCKQENTRNKRKNHLAQSDLGPNSVLNESPGPPLVRAPLQLSPLVRGELEGHMSHKVSTLRAQVVPLPVKKSWEILNHLLDVQGVPEQGLPKTQLPTLLPQRAEQNTSRSPDAPSFHVHVNIGVNSKLSRTEVSQPLTSNKQLQSANDSQVLSYNPVVISVGTPAPINIVREENGLLKKDPRHVLELNIDQRVLGLPEKRIQPQRAQVTDVELTAQVPRSATDSIKVTPVALLQVMGLMGMIPESHAQVIDSVGFPPQPPNQAETVNLTPRPSDQVIEQKTVTSLQHSATESKSMASRLSPVTDNMKVTPEKLLRIMDSMGLINELYPHVIEPAKIAPKPQYQVMESAKVDTLHGHQAIRPEDKSLGLQQSVLGTVEVIPQPQHKVMGTPNTTLGPQNKATEHIGIAPGPIHENILEISSSALPKAIDYTKATPVAQQTMDFMQKIPPGQPHITEPRALIQTENLTPLPAQPDVLTSAVPRGAAESRGIPPQLPSTALASSGVILLPSGQSPHALKVTPIVQAPPGVGMIPPLQVVEPPGLTPQPELQNVKSEPLIPDPRLRNMKSVDIAMDLVPEKVKYGPPTSRAVSTDLTLELHQLTMQFEELTHMPQLQSEESVPSAPESQLQDVKSGQVIVEAQLQNIQAAGLAPGPQGQSDTSVQLTPGSQTQGMQGVVHSALSQELQGDSKMVELAPRPSLEDKKSANLTRKPYSQSTSFEKTAHVPLLEDRKTLLVEGRSLIPEALVESVNLSELVPSTHLCAVKPLEVNPDPSYHFLEPAELALRRQAPEERVGSDICHQVEESVELTQSSLGMRLIPLRQTSDSMEMYSPPLQETLETRNQVVKEMQETPESQNAIKDAPDLLPDSEVQNMNSAVMAPESQPSDGKFLHGTLETCSEVTNLSEITLKPEYEDRETIRLTFPKVDITRGAMIEPYSEMGSLELGLEPGVQGEKSESLAQHLQSVEVIGEPPVLAVEPIALTTGPKPHIKDVIPGPQLEVKLRQMDTESQLQNEESVNVTRQLSLGEVGPEKTKPESGPQSPSPKELIEETQPLKVKSVHLNLGPQQLSIKSGLIPGPQLQSVRFPTFYQGGKRGNFISGPPRYGVKSDEALSRSPVPEIRSSDYIPGPNLPEAKLQHVKPVEVNVGPCLQAVKFSDLTPKPKHQGFRCTQVIPGIHSQDRKSQGLLPESFLPLSQEPQVEDRKLVLPVEVSEFHSRKHTIPASELQYPSVISEEVIPELRQQDTKFSELASRLRLQGVKFGEQTPGPLFDGMHSMIPKLGIHNPKLAKMTPELNDTKQVSFNSGPRLQNVKLFDGTSGTQSEGVTTSELHSGPQLECVKMFEFTTQPERQGMKPELIIQETLFEDRAYVTRNQAPSFEDEMSYKLPSEPQIPTAESVRLTPRIQLASVDHSELVGRPEAQGIESSESIPGQHLGHIKPVEKVTASKQEELTPGPHLGYVKSMELRSKSERGKVKAILLTPGKQAGDKVPEELPRGPNLKGLKSELLPSRPQLENRKSAVLTVGQCPERIKSTVVSPCSSQSDGTKTVKLIPGSTIQDLKTVGLARDTHVQDANAMGLKLEPKQEESPVTFVPGMQFQDEFMEVLQVPQLQGIKPKELTAQSQMRGRKHVIISCLKPQSLKPVNIAKTQGIPGVKLVNLVSTQPCRGMAPTDLTLKPGQDDQITVRSPEWKGRVLDQLSKHFESENVLSMKSGQEAKPADKKPKEIKFKVQFKDTPSFESTPKPVVHSVKPEEAQDEPQVPSMKPCQVTPGPQEHQVKVSEPMLEPPFQDVKTMVFTEPHTGSTKSVRWIPISEFQNEKWVGSDLRLQFQSSTPTELKPSTKWRGVRPSELTVRSKIIQEEKSVGLHLEPQSQQVKTSPLALGLQKTKTLNLTSEPQPQGIKTVDQNKDPPVGSLRSVQWIPGPEFHGVKCLGKNYGSQSQKPSIQLGGLKSSETTVRPKVQLIKTPEASPKPELQEGESLVVESRSPNGESVELNLGPQLQDEKSSTSILGIKQEDARSTEVSSSPRLQGMRSSEVFSEDMLQGEKPKGFVAQSLWQDVKSLRRTFGKALDRKLLQLKIPQFQDGKGSVLTPELDLQGMEPEAVKPGSKLKGLQPEPTNVQAVKDMGINPGAESQVVGFAEQDSDSTIYSVGPSELSARNLKQDGKFHKLSQKQQLQSIKPVVCSHGPHLQHIQSSEVCTKLPDLTSMEFNSEQQVRERKAPDVCTESKLSDELFLEFKSRFCDLSPGCKNLTSNTGTQNVESPKLHPDLDLQGIKSKEFCLGSHLEDVNSACTPDANSQYTNSSEYKPGSYLQNTNFSAHIPEPDPWRINTMCNPGPHFNGMNSVCILGPKLQCVDSTVCNHEPNLQDVNSSACTSVSSPPCVNSSICTPGPSPPCVNSSICTPGPSPPCVNSSVCTPGPSPPCVNSSVCTPGPSPPCVNSSGCTPEPSPPCVNSSGCTPEPSPPCVNSSGCTSEPSPPCVNSSGCTPEPSPPCMNSTECNSKAHCQGENSACIPSQNPQCEHSNRNNLGPLLQGMHSDTTFPAPQIMCVNCVWGSVQTHLQNVNSSACTRRQESQSANSMGYNPGPHLEAPKLQGMKFPELNPGTGIQREMPITVNPGQHLQDLRLELTPGSNIAGIAPAEYNPGPQEQCVNFSELNPGLELQRISLAKLGSGPQLQNIKSFAWTPGSESQHTRSVLLSPGPPFQGVKPSNLSVGAKFQEIPFLKKQFGSRQQTAQPMLTLKPQSTGVDSVEVLPTPLPEDKMFPEMSKQPLFCTNSVNLTPGYGLQDLRSREFSPGPCFQTVMCLKPGSQSQSGNSSEFAPCHGSQCAQSFFAPKPCLQDLKPMELGSQQQSMNRQQIALDETPMVVTQESTRKSLAGPALTSVKFSNLIPELQSQCMKFKALTSELRGQSVKHVKLSSVSLPRSGNSVGLSPSPFLQNVTFGNQIPQTNDQITEPSKVTCRPVYHLVDYAEMNTKIRYQAPKLENYIPLPVYQEDAGSSEMTKGFRHKSTETTEKSMRLFPKPMDTVTESLRMPQQPELQVPGFADLTPTLSDQDSNASELTPQKNYQSLETLEMLSCSWPQVKDFKQSQTQPATGSKRMTLDLKNHATEMTVLTRKVRQQGKEFLRVTSTPVNRETECVEKSPWPYPQDLGPVMGSSEKRSPREQSVASSPRPFYHVPDSAPGITPGPQIPESVGLTSKPWLQGEEFLKLATQPTNQVVGNTASVELTFEECQTEEVGIGLTMPQKASIEKANITPIESLDQIINFVTVSPKPLDQMTEPAKTQLQVPQVSESLTVIPGPPLQVIESVMIPEPTSQGSKYVDLTPKLHDRIVAEFAPRLWLQNVQSKKLIAEPTHHILETIELSGFQVIKTILLPKPLLLVVKSEELAPGPSPQAVEPIGVATRSRTRVKDPLNLLPRPHLQDKIKPIERTRRANIQETFPELIVQQTSPLEEPPVLTHKQRLQAGKSVGIKRESPKVLEMDLNQGRVCQNRDSEMITSEKLQAENYFSRFISSPPIPFISSSVKTSELGPLQGSGRPEVSRAQTMKNSNAGILQSPESYTETIRMRSPALPLVLPSDKTGDSVGSLYPEIWDMDVITKESTEKKQMEEFGNLLQSYAPYPLRLLPSEFQAGLGARRNSIRSFLGRQLNIWESHVCRQRLPRKYLSNMLMLGNVLGTTMERKLCSQPFLTEGATMDICRSIQNLFGVPAELMEFSQSLLERGPRTISQTSVVKNYIQRHILGHGHEKRMPLKMWTRGSTSSIIQQYSGTRLGLKKTNSKLSDIFQEVTQHVPVSCTGAQFPALGKPESPLRILYNREDPVSREPSKTSQSDSQTGTFESHRSKSSYFSQTKTDHSEQLHLLKDLQLKIAAKLLRSQIPHNVPPPPGSGLVLKYPICLQCGQCSGFRCGHELQSGFGSYLLVYPQIHLISTPEGHGETRLHLGFRLRIRKRPHISKNCGRNRADTSKNPSSSHRKAKIYTPASKSPTSTRDFQPRSSQSPASVPVHRRQKQWGSCGVAGKTEAKDSGHYEFCEVLSTSESGSESNRHEKWAKSRRRKTSELNFPMKKITKELKTQNINLYKNSRPTEECPSGTLTDPSRSKSIKTAQTSTVSSKRQPKKSSQPRFIQLLFQRLKQAFQRVMALTAQKPEDRASPDNLWSSKNLYPKEKDEDDCLTGDGRGASTPVIKQRFMGSTPKKEDRLQKTCDQAQQSKQVSSLQRHSPQTKPTSPSDRTLRSLSERRCRSPSQRKDRSPSRRTPQSISDRSRPRLSKGRGRSPAGRSQPSPSGRRSRSSSGRSPRERRGQNSSPKGQLGLYGRNQHSPPFQRCRSPSKRSHLSPTRRTWASSSERSHSTLSERPPSRRSGRTRHSSSGRGYRSPSKSRLHRPSGLHRSHSQRTHYSPSDSRGGHSERNRRLERNPEGHHARPHHSPKGKLRHSSPKERPRHSTLQGTTPETYVWYMGCWGSKSGGMLVRQAPAL